MAKKIDVKYAKDSLVNSVRFESDRDILSAVLSETEEYSIEDVEKIIENYKRKGVK